MARNSILDYIKEKINSDSVNSELSVPRVITISREYGCPGIPIANEVSKALTATNKAEWSVVDKQIVNQAAEELDIPAKLIDQIAKSKPKGVFEELFLAFSDIHLPSDLKIKKTIARILRTVALHGNVVILGRGGAVLARDLQKAVHVHLHASVSWRIGRVKNLENLKSDAEAIGRINVVDNERIFLRNYFAGESPGLNVFDVSYNCEYLSQEEIVKSILQLAQMKGI
ncbi:MAG TPA: cytidylate kinase-like family protein [Leptospiraceae bacterium]|nr:cytidylate kinase-like family protein [Leptospiraceae bacterium]HMX30945.1 cytidylate kinase-like family protein [Leptospiraceae bacterium]HMY30049.1 cytidylate kinase-like family protein [Leptospiraceae bacterium]HMZ62764.1 cytidylate kinase-like family protein [Leptospiraceae bacterium]HNA07357.1 cytidylate kinase-like family protein [Leptospiraceae bacterium]